MGRNARKRISYVLPLANSAGGHRLGVNGLAVDPAHSILYSGGRDGVICAWDLHLDLQPAPPPAVAAAAAAADDDDDNNDRNPFADPPPPTRFRQQVQAHSHWINDLVLARDSQVLVSASSDITVKLWRPAAEDFQPPQTIGIHTDYVKRVASPGPHEHWVASGGLDHNISLWDLNGAGQKLQIHAGDDDHVAKRSVYALAASPSIVASGGPESIVRIWDPRTGKRITKFVGHTDNVRDVLITQDADTILTASSDQTVKVWSMTAGRCMHTLTMHNDSVWSLFSDDPQLNLFYSADRSGLVAKTDVRNCPEIDEGISVAVCQEHEGVNKVVAAGDFLWTATSSSSINRWNDVETAAEVALPESYKTHRSSISTSRSKHPVPPAIPTPPANRAVPKIPITALLRMSNTAPFPPLFSVDTDASTLHSVASTRKPADVLVALDQAVTTPCRHLPDFSIEGQNGLIKHHLLNDRRRVLTLDTAGEVMLWDLLACVPIKSFGKRHLEDVVPEVNTRETVAHWCAVDTRTGSLTCVLEENYCFDAEMYADELQLNEMIEFREDQRINLGKWILVYLFSNLIDEEIKRDSAFRENLLKNKSSRKSPPSHIMLPESNLTGWKDPTSGPTSGATIRPPNGVHLPVMTPGLYIGLATPGLPPMSAGKGSHHTALLTPTTEEGSHPQLEKTTTQRSFTHDQPDYFSRTLTSGDGHGNANGNANGNSKVYGPSDGSEENPPQSPAEDTPTQKKSKGLFGKKFGRSLNMKKFGTSSEKPEAPKPTPADEKAEDSDSHSTKTDERVIEDNFFGAIRKLRQIYEDQANMGIQKIETLIAPSLPNETPVLKPPATTTILIQEDRPDSGGVADLFEGKVGSLGQQADLIEKVAPVWLADMLLRNQIPPKDIVKVSFILEPYQALLPSIAADGNNRLNANRMLRARKILAYVAERIEPAPGRDELEGAKVWRPEEYLELYCQNQLISPTMTLASIRAHVWRGGGDVVLYYKANGRKEIKHAPHAGIASALVNEGVGADEGQYAGRAASGSEAGRSSGSERGE